MPGAYGTLLETLRYMTDAVASHLYRLTGARPARPWRGDGAIGTHVLPERATTLAQALEQFVAADWNAERLGEAYGDREVLEVRVQAFNAQAIRHAAEHRAHVRHHPRRIGARAA